MALIELIILSLLLRIDLVNLSTCVCSDTYSPHQAIPRAAITNATFCVMVMAPFKSPAFRIIRSLAAVTFTVLGSRVGTGRYTPAEIPTIVKFAGSLTECAMTCDLRTTVHRGSSDRYLA